MKRHSREILGHPYGVARVVLETQPLAPPPNRPMLCPSERGSHSSPPQLRAHTELCTLTGMSTKHHPTTDDWAMRLRRVVSHLKFSWSMTLPHGHAERLRWWDCTPQYWHQSALPCQPMGRRACAAWQKLEDGEIYLKDIAFLSMSNIFFCDYFSFFLKRFYDYFSNDYTRGPVFSLPPQNHKISTGSMPQPIYSDSKRVSMSSFSD